MDSPNLLTSFYNRHSFVSSWQPNITIYYNFMKVSHAHFITHCTFICYYGGHPMFPGSWNQSLAFMSLWKSTKKTTVTLAIWITICFLMPLWKEFNTPCLFTRTCGNHARVNRHESLTSLHFYLKSNTYVHFFMFFWMLWVHDSLWTKWDCWRQMLFLPCIKPIKATLYSFSHLPFAC